MQTPVERLTGSEDGGFTATLGDDEVTCDYVVVATGAFGRSAQVPALASEIDPGIRQLHSSEYQRPDELPDGPVLVVGASHSGLDIAYEIAATRPTTLVGPERGNVPPEWGTRRLERAFPVIEFVFNHVLRRRSPPRPRSARHAVHSREGGALSPPEHSTLLLQPGPCDNGESPPRQAGLRR